MKRSPQPLWHHFLIDLNDTYFEKELKQINKSVLHNNSPIDYSLIQNLKNKIIIRKKNNKYIQRNIK